MKFVALSRSNGACILYGLRREIRKEEGHKLGQSRGSIRLEIMTKSKNCCNRNN